MRNSMIVLSAAVLAFAGLPTAAMADDDDCLPRVPRDQWRSAVEIGKVAEDLGYTVREIEVDDGCYEVEASKDGRRYDLYFHPGTAELVEIDADDDDDDRRRGGSNRGSDSDRSF